MKKLQNDTLQRFLDYFIQELKRTNEDRKQYDIKELNIPFIISSLWQSFKNSPDKYKDFVSDLETWSDYVINIEESQNDYNGIVDVMVNLVKYEHCEDLEDYFNNYNYPEHDYKIEFTYDARHWGYCECTPDMPDYREDKHCCGHGCDASFCSFELHKVLHIMEDTWHGDEHDYWDFEDEFYMSDKELADRKAEEDRVRTIKELKDQIETASKKLAELESESY